jgi:hypothetical protein
MIVACATLGLATGAMGCLSDDTSLAPGRDAGTFDAGLPLFDASGSVDGANPPPVDAGIDAPVVDSAVPDATPPVDAGKDAAGPSQAGLVAGGTVGHSTAYRMTVTTGPASAPVLKSPKYQLVGGVSVTARKP